MTKVKFEDTKFGSITISGQMYNHDVYLFPDDIIEKRNKSNSPRIQGHRSLSKWELEKLLSSKPEVLIIGMGQSGVLPMSDETSEWLKQKSKELSINVIKAKTPVILNQVNTMIEEGRRIAGVFHITC